MRLLSVEVLLGRGGMRRNTSYHGNSSAMESLLIRSAIAAVTTSGVNESGFSGVTLSLIISYSCIERL